MKAVLDWLDQRTGFRTWARAVFCENIPGGARWRYVWGGTLAFCIVVEFITGLFLWMGYSPGAQTAWESVNYIQTELFGGWLLRGLHHYTAQVMIVLLVLHLMQVVIDGAYKAPREVNFWLGLILVQIVLGLSMTGYLLPWDQQGFWSTKVRTNILGIFPFIGHDLQKLSIGGPDYGHQTLTRFFALHAGVLPGALIVVLMARVYLFRRHGRAIKEPKRRPDAPFWPDQLLKDAVACLAVLAAVLFLIVRHRVFSASAPLGADLGPPADLSEPFSAARPEWFFLFLYQFLKYFPGQTEIWGAFVIPMTLMGIIFLMPFIGNWKLGHRFNIGFLCCLLAGAALLTCQAMDNDARNAAYQAALKETAQQAERVKVLARSPLGIPVSGAVTLLRNDPLIQGPKLFAKNCASCHRYEGNDGRGNRVKDAQSASDLAGFGSRTWLAGLFDPERVSGVGYFGGTKFKNDKMVKFVKKEVAAYTSLQKEQLGKVIAVVSAEARLKGQSAVDLRDSAMIAEGRTLLKENMKCTDCHQFHAKDEDASAPDLTGYGSRDWLLRFLNNPGHPDFYGDRSDRMPAFGEKQILSPEAVGLIADWLRGDWYEAPEKAAD